MSENKIFCYVCKYNRDKSEFVLKNKEYTACNECKIYGKKRREMIKYCKKIKKRREMIKYCKKIGIEYKPILLYRDFVDIEEETDLFIPTDLRKLNEFAEIAKIDYNAKTLSVRIKSRRLDDVIALKNNTEHFKQFNIINAKIK
jgi:hypothetical protein